MADHIKILKVKRNMDSARQAVRYWPKHANCRWNWRGRTRPR